MSLKRCIYKLLIISYFRCNSFIYILYHSPLAVNQFTCKPLKLLLNTKLVF